MDIAAIEHKTFVGASATVAGKLRELRGGLLRVDLPGQTPR